MAIVFEHDFEDNSLASWDTNDGSVSPTIQTSVVYEGTRALRSQLVGQSARLIKFLTATSTATIRANQRRASPDLAETLIVQSLHNASFNRGIYLQFWGAEQIRIVAAVNFVDTSLGIVGGLALDTWEDLQLGVDASANPWRIRVWRNRTLILDTTFAEAAFNIERATIGAWVYNTTWDIYTDNVQISNEFALITGASPGYQRLYGPALLDTSATTLYTVPTGYRFTIDHIRLVNNTSSPVDVTMSIGADAAGTRLWDSKTLAADLSRSVKGPFTMEAGELFQAFAGTADAVTITVLGKVEAIGIG